MKTLFYKAFFAFILASLLTSCLGNADSYMKIDRDFAYLNYYDVTGDGQDDLVAWVASAGPVIAPSAMKNLETKRGYFVKYKIKPSSTGWYYNADYLDPLDNSEPVPSAKFEWNRAPYFGFQQAQLKDSIHPLSAAIAVWSPNDMMDDSWMISYSVPLKEDEKVEARFYYDPSGQVEGGKPLEANRAIIDVRFVKVDKSTEAGNATTESLNTLGSLAQLRASYIPTYPDDSESVSVLLKFRFIGAPLRDKEPTIVTTVGSFIKETGNVYYMDFYKKK